MLKVNFKPFARYAEETQPNPLQWAIVAPDEDGVFQQSSAWIICKDFFNDLAYFLQTGHGFSIYGFNAGQIGGVYNKHDPVFMVVKNFKPTFVNNVDKVNDYLASKGYPIVQISNVDKDHLLIKWDPWFFSNTYYISLMSLIIRLCNYGHAFNSFGDLVKTKDFATKDQQKWDQVVNKGVFFDLPEKVKDYVWYYGPNCNSESKFDNYRIPSLVHNCGVLAWQGGF